MAFTLSEWLKELAALTPRARGLTGKRLAQEYGDDLGVWSHGSGTSHDAWIVMNAIAHIGRFAEGEERHAAWARAFDWKDSDAWGELPAMMGLTWPDLRAGGWSVGDNEVLDILTRCNQLAIERGIDERLYSLATGGDNYVIVMLSPAAAEGAVPRKLLDLDLRRPPPFEGDAPAPAPVPVPVRAVAGENSDLLIVAGVALLALPVFLIWREPVFTVVPVFVAVLMLRQPLARRVSWLRWLR